MAQTKRDQDRAEKRDEIIAAARTLFIETGYEDTSISRLAAAAGVAPNTIYWYFKDKDEVLVAVLDAEFSEGMAEYLQLPVTDAAERLFWVVQRLERVWLARCIRAFRRPRRSTSGTSASTPSQRGSCGYHSSTPACRQSGLKREQKSAWSRWKVCLPTR